MNNEIIQLIQINVLRDIELAVLTNSEKPLKEILKDLEVRYGYSK